MCESTFATGTGLFFKIFKTKSCNIFKFLVFLMKKWLWHDVIRILFILYTINNVGTVPLLTADVYCIHSQVASDITDGFRCVGEWSELKVYRGYQKKPLWKSSSDTKTAFFLINGKINKIANALMSQKCLIRNSWNNKIFKLFNERL